jgi:hypothetical protein
MEANWESRLGAPLAPELRAELQTRPVLSGERRLFVYLCSGSVDEISPATSVAMTRADLVVMHDSTPVATYQRNDVLFCSKQRVSPFPI